MITVAESAAELRALIGSESEPTITEVEKGAIRRFALAIGDPNPLYLDEDYARRTRFGGIIAPPTFAAYFKFNPIKALEPVAVPSRVLHTDDQILYYQPFRPGDVITTVAKLVNVFERTGKVGSMLFQTLVKTMTNHRGEVASTVELTTVRF